MPMVSMATAAPTIARKNRWARVVPVVLAVLAVLVALVEWAAQAVPVARAWLARAVPVDQEAMRPRPKEIAVAVRLAMAMAPKRPWRPFCSA